MAFKSMALLIFAFLLPNFSYSMTTPKADLGKNCHGVLATGISHEGLPQFVWSRVLSDAEISQTRVFTDNDFEGLQVIGDGSESEVFRNGNIVLKKGEPYNAPETAGPRIRDILYADQLFGSGKLTLAGHWVGKNGVINPVFSQPFVEGRGATQAEINQYMKSKGFTESDKKKTFYKDTPEGRVIAYDLDADNVLVDTEGQLIVIDASAYIEKQN